MAKQSQSRKHLDVSRLNCPKLTEQFVLELRNRFASLAEVDEDPNINNKWETIKKTYVETGTNVGL